MNINNIIFYVVSSLISLILLWQIIEFLIRSFKRLKLLKLQKIEIRFGKRHLRIATFLCLLGIVSFVFVSWRNSRIYKDNIFRMDYYGDNTYLARGNISKIVIDYWNVKNHYGNIIKSDWSRGETYIINEKNQKLQKISHLDSKDSSLNKEGYLMRKREEYEYSSLGFISSTKYFDDDGELLRVYDAKFDKSGQPKYATTYLELDGSVINTEQYTFKNKNYLIEKTYDDENKLSRELHLKFWKPGILRKSKFYFIKDGDKQLYSTTDYNRLGMATYFKLYSTNKGKTENYYNGKFSRDNKGQILSITSDIGSYPKKRAEFRVYDTKGNWTELLWFEDGIPNEIVTRKISYYK